MKYLSAVLGALAALTAFAYAGFLADFSAAFLGSSFSLLGIAMLVASYSTLRGSGGTARIFTFAGVIGVITALCMAGVVFFTPYGFYLLFSPFVVLTPALALLPFGARWAARRAGLDASQPAPLLAELLLLFAVITTISGLLSWLLSLITASNTLFLYDFLNTQGAFYGLLDMLLSGASSLAALLIGTRLIARRLDPALGAPRRWLIGVLGLVSAIGLYGAGLSALWGALPGSDLVDALIRSLLIPLTSLGAIFDGPVITEGPLALLIPLVGGPLASLLGLGIVYALRKRIGWSATAALGYGLAVLVTFLLSLVSAPEADALGSRLGSSVYQLEALFSVLLIIALAAIIVLRDRGQRGDAA